MHIDGDWSNDWSGGGYYQQDHNHSGRFFMLTEDSDSEDEELNMMCGECQEESEDETVPLKSVYSHGIMNKFLSANDLQNYEFPYQDYEFPMKSKSVIDVAEQGKTASEVGVQEGEREYRDRERSLTSRIASMTPTSGNSSSTPTATRPWCYSIAEWEKMPMVDKQKRQELLAGEIEESQTEKIETSPTTAQGDITSNDTDSEDDEISLPVAGPTTAAGESCVRELGVIHRELEQRAIEGERGWFGFGALDRVDPVLVEEDFGDWENASCPDLELEERDAEIDEEESTVDPEDRPSVDGSIGTCPPVLTMAGGVEPDEHGNEAIPKPKPEVLSQGQQKSSGRRRNPKKLARMELATGEFVKNKLKVKTFEEYTVGELRSVVDGQFCSNGPLAYHWMDELCMFEDEGEDDGKSDKDDKPLLGFSWKSEPKMWNAGKWIKVDSVVDSGASAPVASPSMAPNATIRPSEGSRRGQKYTSASKHKLKKLGSSDWRLARRTVTRQRCSSKSLTSVGRWCQ